MCLDVKIRPSNKFWARHLVDTVAMWLKCNTTPPFREDSRQAGSPHCGVMLPFLASYVRSAILTGERYLHSQLRQGTIV